jgi:hypothetical protein
MAARSDPDRDAARAGRAWRAPAPVLRCPTCEGNAVGLDLGRKVGALGFEEAQRPVSGAGG